MAFSFCWWCCLSYRNFKFYCKQIYWSFYGWGRGGEGMGLAPIKTEAVAGMAAFEMFLEESIFWLLCASAWTLTNWLEKGNRCWRQNSLTPFCLAVMGVVFFLGICFVHLPGLRRVKEEPRLWKNLLCSNVFVCKYW